MGTSTTPVTPEILRNRVTALLRGYGPRRIAYLRAVADLSPESLPPDAAATLLGSPGAVTAAHDDVERAWAAKGAPTPLITVDAEGGHVMTPDVADVVRFVVHDLVDEPDPLAAIAY